MDFRQGTCSACKNSFRVPATFTAEKAKCPKCAGVVEIGPVQAGGSSAPSASVAPPAVPAAPAASAPPVPAKAPAPKPAAPMPVATSEPRPAPKVATPAPVAKPSVRAATVAAKERVRAKGLPASDTAETTRGGRPRRETPKKKSPAPLIVGGLVVVAVLAVVVMKFAGGDEPVAAPKVVAPVAKPDLSHIPDAVRLEATDPVDWQAMEELMGQYMSAPDSKSRDHAGDRLVSRGLKSVPAILNGFKKLDFSNDKGAELGTKIQMNLLQGQCKGTNFGWRREARAEDVAFNIKVIEKWFAAWNEAKDDVEKWVAISQRAAAEAAAAKPPSK